LVSAVTWIDAAIQVNGAAWPVLQMPWIDGRTLNEYVDFLVTGSNAAALGTLAQRWRELIALLQGAEFAHGDLQHGNVLVDTGGSLRLVDFDGIWIPQLAGLSPPTEYGHPNYQHPGRHPWGRWLDTFSALVIYTSLVALGKDPGLWLALYNSKNLLFSKGDFYPPHQTEVWKQLAGLRDPEVDELARRLKQCCDPAWTPSMSLEGLLARAAPAPAPSAPVQRWWELTPNAVTLPAPPPLSAPLGTAGTGPLPQLNRTTPPAGSTWWTTGPPPPAQQPPVPPATRPRQSLAAAAATLGLGILLLIIGAVQGVAVLVFIGLALGAGGVYLLIARPGSPGPP
jgi:hypothetical protein